MKKIFIYLISVDNNNVITDEKLNEILPQIYSYDIDCMLNGKESDMDYLKWWLKLRFEPILVEYAIANIDRLMTKYMVDRIMNEYWYKELARNLLNESI